MQNQNIPYQLIAADMDGTLLNSAHQITPRSKAAITEALRRGRHVVFATGRCLAEAQDYLDEFPDMRYLICENGASVYDCKAKKSLFRAPLPSELTERIIQIVEKEDVLVCFYIGNRAFAEGCTEERLISFGLESFVETLKKTVIRVPDLFAFYRDNPLEAEKITLFFRDDATRRRVRGKLASMPVQMASSMFGNLEISAAGVDKGMALRSLCEILSISPEQVIAVGDGNNDMGMLRAAGLPVAMANAAQEVLRIAKKRTLDCDHDGVAVIMEEYLL